MQSMPDDRGSARGRPWAAAAAAALLIPLLGLPAAAQRTERLSVDSSGIEGNGDSQHPSISADGRYVAFQSEANDLVPGDSNFASDAFLRDRMDCAGSAMTYCTAKLSSSGCTPRVGWTGTRPAPAARVSRTRSSGRCARESLEGIAPCPSPSPHR